MKKDVVTARRGFLGKSLVAAVTATALPAVAEVGGAETAPAGKPLGELGYADFAGRVGETFYVSAFPRRIPMTLASVDACVENTATCISATAARRQPFSLRFEAPANTELGSGIHGFRHQSLGRMELFTNPIGQRRAGRFVSYEVIFG